MAMLHFFGGEKGGVGKSFVARAAVEFHLEQEIEFALFDADRSNADVLRICKKEGCREAIFSENVKDEDKADSIYLTAMTKRTLVNLPAQITVPFLDWFEKNDLLEAAKEDGVKFIYWFVSNGSYDSLKMFEEYLDHFQRKVSFVFVKNEGVCDEWEQIKFDKSLKEKIKKYEVTVINFPKLRGIDTRHYIDRNSLTFGAAKKHENENFHRLDRRRVSKFVETVSEVFGEIEVLYDDVDIDEYSKVEESRLVKVQEAAAS